MRYVLLIAAMLLASRSLGQEIVEIPSLTPLTNTHILDVSNDGSVVLGVSDHLQDRAWRRYFVWTPTTGSHVIPSHPDWDHTWASALSGDGRVVVGGAHTTSGDAGVAWRWTVDSGFEVLPLPAGVSFANAEGVNVDGSAIVGSFARDDRAFAFRWMHASGITELGTLPGIEHHHARYVSDDGGVVAGIAASRDGFEDRMPFRWTSSGGMSALGRPAGETGIASISDMSADGRTIIANYYSLTWSGCTPYLWDADSGGFVAVSETGLGLGPWASDSYIGGMSSQSSVLIGSVYTGGVLAFVWTPDLGVVDIHAFLRARGIDASTWTINGISDGGTVLIASISRRPARSAIITNFSLPTNCPPDIDLNEQLDTFDFMAFINRFNSGDLRADLDGDGVLTIGDFLAYQTAFDAGC